MCPDHKEEVTHYCKTCQRLVCQLCRVRRTHSGHKITPVLSAYQALKVSQTTCTLSHLLLLLSRVRAPPLSSLLGQTDKEPDIHPRKPGHSTDPDL